MVLIFIRTIFIYVFILIVMRGMGKRQLGQMQPFEFVIAMILADLAATPMAEIGIPIFYGLIPILGLLFMHILISILNLKSIRFRQIICGKPRILIYRGKIDETALKKENITINELQERLRINEVNSISDVDFAILETTGEVTIILKPEKRNLTPEDLNLDVQYSGITYDLIVDGKIMNDNLRVLNKDTNWLEREMKKLNTKPKDVLVATIDGRNEIFCQVKEKNLKGKKE